MLLNPHPQGLGWQRNVLSGMAKECSVPVGRRGVLCGAWPFVMVAESCS